MSVSISMVDIAGPTATHIYMRAGRDVSILVGPAGVHRIAFDILPAVFKVQRAARGFRYPRQDEKLWSPQKRG
jgi:hypothetical protein